MSATYYRTLLLCLVAFMGPSGATVAQTASDMTKPGLYRLKLTNDASLCMSIRDLINKDIETAGKISFSAHPSFLNWAVVKGNQNALRDPAPEDVFEMVVDIDNDGTSDHVFKGISSIGRLNVDYLFIFSSERADAMRKAGLDYAKLFGADRKIEFVDVVNWITRAKQKYGKDWEAWTPGPLSVLQVFRHLNGTYVLGYNPAADRDQSAEVYVFQVLPKDEIRDICMFHRVCPCGGCRDLKGQIGQCLPAPQLCRN